MKVVGFMKTNNPIMAISIRNKSLFPSFSSEKSPSRNLEQTYIIPMLLYAFCIIRS